MQSLECMMGYNSVSPAEHAATIRDLMHASLLGSRKRPRDYSQPDTGLASHLP